MIRTLASTEKPLYSHVSMSAAAAVSSRRATPAKAAPPARGDRELRREIANLERSIQRLDEEKKRHHAALLEATDQAAALAAHTAFTDVAARLAAAEERWLELQESPGGEG